MVPKPNYPERQEIVDQQMNVAFFLLPNAQLNTVSHNDNMVENWNLCDLCPNTTRR